MIKKYFQFFLLFCYASHLCLADLPSVREPLHVYRFYDPAPHKKEDEPEKEPKKTVPKVKLEKKAKRKSFFSKALLSKVFFGVLTGGAAWGVSRYFAQQAFYSRAEGLPKNYSNDYTYRVLKAKLRSRGRGEVLAMSASFSPFYLRGSGWAFESTRPECTDAINAFVFKGEGFHNADYANSFFDNHIFIHFHSSNGNMLTHLGGFWKILEYNAEVVTFDYRGYGGSTGSVSAKSTVEDGLGVLDAVTKLYPGKKIIILAQSLGGPIALRSVIEWSKIKSEVQERLAAVVMQGSFTSYQAAGC